MSESVEFFIPIHLDSLNRRQGRHWAARWRKDKGKGDAAFLMFCASVPVAWRVSAPHPRRRVIFTVIRRRELDKDNLWGGLKPVIDGLKCQPIRVKGVPKIFGYTEGLYFDDRAQFVDLDAKQELWEKGFPEGVEEGIKVEVSIVE